MRDHFAVRAQHRVHQLPVADGSPVDEQPHRPGAPQGEIGRSGESMRANAPHAPFKRDQSPADVRAQSLDRTIFKGGPGVGAKQRSIAVAQDHADIAARKRESQHRLDGVSLFGALALEELLSRGHVEEQIAHLDGGARRRAGLAEREHLPTLHLDARSRENTRLTGEQREARDGSDRRQRLAAKPMRADREEIFFAGQLAGRVARQTQARILAPHSAAIVAHANQPASALEQIDFDSARTRVKGVLNQFLHHGGGPLDHLARCNLVRERRREHMDSRHGPRSIGHDHGAPQAEAGEPGPTD